MSFSAVLRSALLSVLMVTMSITTTKAASLYNVADLGTNFTFVKDSTGYTTSVTSGDGSQSYAFAKYPVDYTNTLIQYQAEGSPPTYFNFEQSVYQVAQNKYGILDYTLRVGPGFSYVGETIAFAPNNVSFALNEGNSSPVFDFNIHGEVVGTDFNQAQDSLSGILNNQIASSLGLNLTNALFVDDFGRIIAEGTLPNGTTQDFLLTPTNLPAAAPEPSTLALLAAVLTALCIRSAYRRRAT